jgi:hypothetical protein
MDVDEAVVFLIREGVIEDFYFSDHHIGKILKVDNLSLVF